MWCVEFWPHTTAPNALLQDLVKLKATRYPKDDRIIRVCGITAENNVHVEWHHRGIEGTN